MRSQFSRALSHFELFERDTRRAELSPPGRSLLPDARGDLTNGGNEESRQFGRQDRCAANLDCSRRIFRPRAPDCLRILQADVPEVSPGAIERHWLCETRMVTVCASTHPLATSSEPTTLEEPSHLHDLAPARARSFRMRGAADRATGQRGRALRQA